MVNSFKDVKDGYKTEVYRYQDLYLKSIAGVIGFIAIYFTYRRIKALEDQAKVANEQVIIANKNTRISENGHFTDRFTTAIEQLANDNEEIKLGGVYALAGLAKDSEKYHTTVMKVFCAYVRNNSSRVNKNRAMFISKRLESSSGMKNVKNNTVIQAILTSIGNRKIKHDPDEKFLDLSNTNLSGYDLKDTNLNGIDLSGVSLKKTNLSNADLRNVNLEKADLRNSILIKADLRKANLDNANLKKTNLMASNFIEASLMGTNFYKANLLKANMKKAVFFRANLKKAGLIDANLSEADFLEADLNGAFLFKSDLSKADFRDAILNQVDLHEANLIEVKNLTKEQLILTESLYAVISLNNNLETELKIEHPHLFKRPDIAPSLIPVDFQSATSLEKKK